LENKILKLLKPEFRHSQKAKIFHFQQILNERRKSQKYAKYEALFLAEKPVFTRVFGSFFMSVKKEILAKKRLL